MAIENNKLLQNFITYVMEVTGRKISELTDEKINNLYNDFEIGNLSDNLYKKVASEYARFIEDMKKQSAEYIIESAYEIVWKDNINQFIENEAHMLSKEQYVALLSVEDTLEEIYSEWLSNGELHTYEDIAVLLEDTAGNILASLDNKFEE